VRQRFHFTEPIREAQHREQQRARNQKARAARPDRWPRGDEPFGADVVAAPQKHHEQQSAGDGRVVFLFQHAAKLSESGKVAKGI
jgi:hypothetical protein